MAELFRFRHKLLHRADHVGTSSRNFPTGERRRRHTSIRQRIPADARNPSSLPHRRSRRILENSGRGGRLHLLRRLLCADRHRLHGAAVGRIPPVRCRPPREPHKDGKFAEKLPAWSTFISRGNRRRALQPLARDGNLHRAVDRVGRDYARVLI